MAEVAEVARPVSIAARSATSHVTARSPSQQVGVVVVEEEAAAEGRHASTAVRSGTFLVSVRKVGVDNAQGLAGQQAVVTVPDAAVTPSQVESTCLSMCTRGLRIQMKLLAVGTRGSKKSSTRSLLKRPQLRDAH